MLCTILKATINIINNIKMNGMKNERINSKGESGEGGKKQSIKNLVDQKLLEQRKVFLWGQVDSRSARDIVSKLLYLESVSPGGKIEFFINSPGGEVSSGFSILDTMNLISSPVSTICMGLAASMGSILLSAGKKGERYIFPLGEVMIHQPSIGQLQGTAVDLEIQSRQIMKTKETAANILADNCEKTAEEIYKDFDRDYWMDAEESIEYGIVDKLYKMK
jgi:ATP-dependent Clp protease protease subunit